MGHASVNLVVGHPLIGLMIGIPAESPGRDDQGIEERSGRTAAQGVQHEPAGHLGIQPCCRGLP
jgi:hypothetical protein